MDGVSIISKSIFCSLSWQERCRQTEIQLTPAHTNTSGAFHMSNASSWIVKKATWPHYWRYCCLHI